MGDLQKNVQDSVLTLTLNRPDRLNAFSGEMIEMLKNAVKEAKQMITSVSLFLPVPAVLLVPVVM